MVLLESAYGLSVAPGALLGVLKHCKLQYKIDLTIKNPSVFQHFNASCAAGGAQTL